mmetsp:Transcript_26190/g.31020  ORF Transcript_26190/g.31020 Transcript_26190/m.31020 type:complete len:132 (+) Transcript_26190:3-398(+)
MYEIVNQWLDKPNNFPMLDQLLSVSITQEFYSSDDDFASEEPDQSSLLTVLFVSFAFIGVGLLYIFKIEPYVKELKKKYETLQDDEATETTTDPTDPPTDSKSPDNTTTSSQPTTNPLDGSGGGIELSKVH